MDYPEHPLITDIDTLSTDQLMDKVNELQKKLGIAYRLGNAYLCDQIRMSINTYQAKYQEKMRKPGKDNNFDEIIDIS